MTLTGKTPMLYAFKKKRSNRRRKTPRKPRQRLWLPSWLHKTKATKDDSA